MKEYLVFIPMIGGIITGIIAVIMSYRQNTSSTIQNNKVQSIIDAEDLPIEDVVKTVLQIQLEHQKKDKWMERVIGFLMGLVSSIIGSIIFYVIMNG